MKSIFPIFLVLLVFSCTNPYEKDHNNSTDEIVLNDGEKWKVDDNMLAIIRLMEQDIVAYNDSSSFTILNENLNHNLDSLTSNCTMTGVAHDELHKWLLPYIDQLKDLSEANTQEDQAKKVELLRLSFEHFNTYFN